MNQTVASYRHYLELIRGCDAEIDSHLKEFESRVEVDEPPSSSGGSRRKPKGNGLDFDVKTHMHRLFGTDLTEIDGISGLMAHVFFTEVGPDLSKFKTVGHFCSWLGLCPNNKISGGKILSSHTRPGSNHLAHALRLSANSLWNSKSYLGDYFRRMRARHGAPKAITATAHKLARIIYHLVKEQKAFDETIFAEQEQAHQARLRKRLAKQAKSLGLQLVPA